MIDEVLALNDDGISGGGNVEPVVKPTLFDELSWSRVGGFMIFANGFGARGAVEPNGFVVPERNMNEGKIDGSLFFFGYLSVQ